MIGIVPVIIIRNKSEQNNINWMSASPLRNKGPVSRSRRAKKGCRRDLVPNTKGYNPFRQRAFSAGLSQTWTYASSRKHDYILLIRNSEGRLSMVLYTLWPLTKKIWNQARKVCRRYSLCIVVVRRGGEKGMRTLPPYHFARIGARIWWFYEERTDGLHSSTWSKARWRHTEGATRNLISKV